MNPLKFEQGIFKVTLTPPEPMQRDKIWYEFLEYRKANCREYYKYQSAVHPCLGTETDFEVWIASEIPKPTPEQLRAIGMRCPAGRPTLLVSNRKQVIWTGENTAEVGRDDGPCACTMCKAFIGRNRFVIVPVEKQPIPPPEVHNLCTSCGTVDCLSDEPAIYNCSNYTPKAKAEQPAEEKFSITEVADAAYYVLRIYDGLHYADLCREFEKELRERLVTRRGK